ncbi:hypothetical protein [Hymenobacter sp. CRA2]|uniref:hypothetical protein n=1 Tax=Hymenobacter sp. CRA2 TaxID=1955620 RepID=UPI00098F4A09|nr:hypothetical protein [Hymenobacter sp. CRA2]OON69602.1 hypothetical protein B0919_06585 [Hymenobacter sp. CRA2]
MASSPALFRPYFQNAAASISYAPNGNYLVLSWSAVKASPEELRAVYEQALRAMQQQGIRKVLSNHGARPPLPAAVSTWVAEEWIPQAVRETGYSHCAVVENQSALGRLVAQSIGAQLPGKLLTFRYFPTQAEAAAWLGAR